MTKKLSLLFALMLSTLMASAYDAQIDGIYYNFNSSSKQATVTSGDTKYTGSVTIPESFTYDGVNYSVTSIEYGAFYNCKALTSITIPNSVKYIGDEAFKYCCINRDMFINNSTLDAEANNYWGLLLADNDFYISEGVLYTYIGSENSITIPNSVTSIGGRAFYNCSGLTSVTIPNSVIRIEEYAFSGCSGLTSITIPNSVTSIGFYAFSGCSRLTSVTILNGVTSIGNNAFSNCSGLTTVEIPNSVTAIRDCAFYGCSGLIEMTIPNSVKSIGEYAFYGCYIERDKFVNNSSLDAEANNYWGLTLLDSREDGFWISNGVLIKYVGSESSITIPSSVKAIGNRAFEGCSSLTSIEIPNSVKSIGSSAFNNCSGLTSVTLHSNAVVSGTYSYYNSLKEIFGTQVKEYTIGEEVTTIGESAFYNCSGLTSVTIPNSVTSIGNYAFSGCSGLTEVTIPNSVTSIGEGAFYCCYSLTSVSIPNSVTTIGNLALYGTAWYKNQPDGMVYVGKVAYGYKGTMPANTSISIIEGTLAIAGIAFAGCSGLTSVTIPNSVTTIGSQAFYECSSLTSVYIPSSIKSIGAYAFGNCSELLDVYCYARKSPAMGTKVFDNSGIQFATLYVPEVSLNGYKATEPWSGFGTIKTLSGDIPETQKCATPTISYENGKLTFSCDTEGATFQYSITDTDIKAGSGNEVQLTTTYKVTVYATKDGYENSDVATKDINVSGGTSGLRGDVNNDGTVNMPDAMFIVNKILNGKFPDEE